MLLNNSFLNKKINLNKALSLKVHRFPSSSEQKLEFEKQPSAVSLDPI